MPYYVYAIHKDQTNNRLYEKFDDFDKAAALEKRVGDAQVPSDNYFVRMFFKENDDLAYEFANSLRPHPK